jgi:hypothetical protein
MLRKVARRFGVVRELFSFLWKEKLWWMIPMVVVLLLVGILILFAHASAVAPWIYTLF